MKKITLPYTPEKNVAEGIRIETGETSSVRMDIIAGQIDYTLPDRNILGIYIYIPFDLSEVQEI